MRDMQMTDRYQPLITVVNGVVFYPASHACISELAQADIPSLPEIWVIQGIVRRASSHYGHSFDKVLKNYSKEALLFQMGKMELM